MEATPDVAAMLSMNLRGDHVLFVSTESAEVVPVSIVVPETIAGFIALQEVVRRTRVEEDSTGVLNPPTEPTY